MLRQLFDVAMMCMSLGQVDLARDMLRSLRRQGLARPHSRRAETIYLFVAGLPGWCSPILMRGLHRSLGFKDRATGALKHPGTGDGPASPSISQWRRGPGPAAVDGALESNDHAVAARVDPRSTDLRRNEHPSGNARPR